jgi:putative ABC transport system ATP-binding protein
MEDLILLKDVEKSYKLPGSTVKVLHGVNLTVRKSEFVAVMGPSGSGKSTLLHIIGCLDRPTAGKYLLEGLDVNLKTDEELAWIRNNKIGFVFQNFNLLPRIPVWKNVELPLIYSGMSAPERKERSYSILKRVGLEHRANHNPSEISGGEQQRAAIARALINNPIIILADEPTGNLDSTTGTSILELFRELNEEGATIVLVTHEKTVSDYAERIVMIRDGICVDGMNER